MLEDVLAEFTRQVRASSHVNQRSGVSVRFTIANKETMVASSVRRALRTGEGVAVPRVSDLPSTVQSSMGRVEFEVFEEGREPEILRRLLATAVLEVFRERLSGFDFRPWLDQFDEGVEVTSGDLVGSDEMLRQAEPLGDLTPLLQRLGVQAESPAHTASALEFALEGLHLTRRLNKTTTAGGPATGDDRRGGHRARTTGAGRRNGDDRLMTNRYARWDGSQDPFGPDIPVDEAVGRLNEHLLDGMGCRVGAPPASRGGATRTVWWAGEARGAARRNSSVSRSGGGGSPTHLEQFRERLEEVQRLEREALAGRDDDDARFAEMLLDALPDSPTAQVNELRLYEFASDEAEQAFSELLEDIRRQVLESHMRGIAEAMRNPDPEQMARLKDMVADLNAMLERRAAGDEPTQERVRRVHATVTASSSPSSRPTSTSCCKRSP